MAENIVGRDDGAYSTVLHALQSVLASIWEIVPACFPPNAVSSRSIFLLAYALSRFLALLFPLSLSRSRSRLPGGCPPLTRWRHALYTHHLKLH